MIDIDKVKRIAKRANSLKAQKTLTMTLMAIELAARKGDESIHVNNHFSYNDLKYHEVLNIINILQSMGYYVEDDTEDFTITISWHASDITE